MSFLFLIVTALCVFGTFRYRKTVFLVIPFLTLFIYFLIQIILVPAPFMETVKFIFNLR
ncbi:hypothetical protein SAMN05421736_108137 [Evansella caseinilytica]|uniref:Uncharacterized protein n=1 Tax=Evansella caseinilytica TaxID=1503961 RepID=A0A1H3RJK9_9BACI|nr:hypothetical protein [Evansella caseinilytica]SDZ25877.1 hypothetical protein SAMN05421736_108137 [Evansella caseinilytica]